MFGRRDEGVWKEPWNCSWEALAGHSGFLPHYSVGRRWGRGVRILIIRWIYALRQSLEKYIYACLFKENKPITKKNAIPVTPPSSTHMYSDGLFLNLTHSALLLEVVSMYAWLMEKISAMPRHHATLTHSWPFQAFVMEIIVNSSYKWMCEY